MSRYMLDTNICIYIIKNKPINVKERFESVKDDDLFISSITVSELLHGVYKSQYIEKNLKALENFLLRFEIADYGYSAAIEYGKIRATLEQQGRVIGQMDMLIAAHGLAENMTIVTNNTKEFERIEKIRLENWV